ncbi:CatB-related O-acetyltransferase [Niallia sp. FSL W8-0635]
MGEYSYGRPKVIVHKGDVHRVFVGKFCSIANGVEIFVGGNHNTEWISTYPFRVKFNLEGKYADGQPSSKGDVIIENDVWIGSNALILSGVKIGNGAIIAANSVVTKDVKPYTIVGGNPAKVIRQRFSNEDITRLLELNWWDWEKEKIISNIHLLSSTNINSLFKDN